MRETIEQFRARGGQVKRVKARKAPGERVTREVTPEEVEAQVREGCPWCITPLSKRKNPDGGVFFACFEGGCGCLLGLGYYYYIGRNGERGGRK